ncbi:MAG: hypothetical protein M3114_07690, partial [Thermoproteota archaeon]|nr:hypothetical protein [Thermoproteota archaeon]
MKSALRAELTKENQRAVSPRLSDKKAKRDKGIIVRSYNYDRLSQKVGTNFFVRRPLKPTLFISIDKM